MYGNLECGKVEILSVVAVGFLALSLVTVVSVTASSQIKEIFQSRAACSPTCMQSDNPSLCGCGRNTGGGNGGGGGGGRTCTPTTCAAHGANCGLLSDGCGTALNCGSCTAPQTCAGGGSANICGQTSPVVPPPGVQTTQGYDDPNIIINPNNTTPNTVGYNCAANPGKCAPGVRVSGFYLAPNGKYYPVAQSAGGPSSQQLAYIAVNQAAIAAVNTLPTTNTSFGNANDICVQDGGSLVNGTCQYGTSAACKVCRAGLCSSTRVSPCNNANNGCSTDSDCTNSLISSTFVPPTPPPASDIEQNRVVNPPTVNTAPIPAAQPTTSYGIAAQGSASLKAIAPAQTPQTLTSNTPKYTSKASCEQDCLAKGGGRQCLATCNVYTNQAEQQKAGQTALVAGGYWHCRSHRWPCIITHN